MATLLNIKERTAMNKHADHGHGMPDPEKIKEILDVVSDSVPELL